MKNFPSGKKLPFIFGIIPGLGQDLNNSPKISYGILRQNISFRRKIPWHVLFLLACKFDFAAVCSTCENPKMLLRNLKIQIPSPKMWCILNRRMDPSCSLHLLEVSGLKRFLGMFGIIIKSHNGLDGTQVFSLTRCKMYSCRALLDSVFNFGRLRLRSVHVFQINYS